MADTVDSVARLKWLCRRGMRELDQVTDGFLSARYATAGSAQQQAFRTLLELPDPELLTLLLGTTATDDQSVNQVLSQMRELSNP